MGESPTSPAPPDGRRSGWTRRAGERPRGRAETGGDRLDPRPARNQHHAAVGRVVLVLPPASPTPGTPAPPLRRREAPPRLGGALDLYIGGAEHAVLHLLYSRFWHKVLFDLGIVPAREPFPRLFHPGIILGEGGEKMSKSRGNVVSPGRDHRESRGRHPPAVPHAVPRAARGHEALEPPRHRGRPLLPAQGLARVPRRGRIPAPRRSPTARPSRPELALSACSPATVKKVGEDIDALGYNTAIAQMMTCATALPKAPALRRATVPDLPARVLAPFAPHMAEELWACLGGASPIHAAPPLAGLRRRRRWKRRR